MSSGTIGIVGAGRMGRGLVRRLTEAGRPVLITDRNRARADRIAAEDAEGGPRRAAGVSLAKALTADVVVLAFRHPETLEFARENSRALAGKIVIDISNPHDHEARTPSVLPHDTSAAEELAAAIPESRIVKAFNTVPSATLLAGGLGETVLDIFVASDDRDAKVAVMRLLQGTGLRGIDAGALANARLLEQLHAFGKEIALRYEIGFDFGIKFLPSHSLLTQG